jgi:uncharacterized protein (DUF427 family)
VSATEPRLPGPDHPITIHPSPARVVVSAGDHIVADTTRALELREASYPGVLYVPNEDVDRSVLADSQTTTYCPYKGEASYYSIAAGDQEIDDAIWYYPEPYPAVGEIAGHVAFYADRVQIDVGQSR